MQKSIFNINKINQTKNIVLVVLYFAFVFSTLFSPLTVLGAETTFTTSLTTTGLTTLPPSIPSNLVATAVSHQQIDLSWTASIPNYYAIGGYRIFRDSIFIATTTSTSYSDTGLNPDTGYSYNVEAFDTLIQLSGQSTTAYATTTSAPIPTPTPTSPPGGGGGGGGGGSGGTNTIEITNINIIPGTNQAEVRFTTSIAAQTKLQWGFTTDFEIGTQLNAFYGFEHSQIITGLSEGLTYKLRINANGANGASTYKDVSFTTVLPVAEVGPLPNPTNFVAEAKTDTIELSWINPTDPRFNDVRIVRTEGFYPIDQHDGIPLYEGDGESFIDTTAKPGVTYYYAIFSRDRDLNYSSGALAQARIALEGEIVTPTIIDPFANIPQASDVDPMFKALKLSDFEFIQDGRNLANVGETVAIHGDKNLTIRLQYNKVPKILKTIAFTLKDPTDANKVFPFLLRANADKTYYEATIGALGRSGRYGMSVAILDYENNGLVRLNGTLAALAFTPWIDFTNNFDLLGLLILFLLILLIILAIAMIRKWARNHPDYIHANKNPDRSFGGVNSKKAYVSIVLLIIINLAIFGINKAQAGINQQINYQGKLTSSLNAVVPDGSYNIRFKLYTTRTGGAPIWTETWCNTSDCAGTGIGTDDRITISNGLFSTMLGSTTALTGIDFNQTLYLGVEIGGSGAVASWDGEMSPRKILGAVPAAFVAEVSNTLSGLNSSQFLRSDAQNATSSATTFINVMQSGAGKIAEFFGSASQSVLSILSNGNVGIGTSTPYSRLSVAGTVVADNFVATSTTASTFPYASSTALTVSGTNGLQLAGGLNGLLQAVNGLVSSTSTLSIGYGGTGLSTAPSYGQVLLGNALGGYTLTSTSSLGIDSGWDSLSDISLIKGYFVVGDDAGFAQATSSLFVSSVGNVGIGSTSPTSKLVLNGGSFTHTASGNPTLVGTYDTSGSSNGVYISGKYAYVADGTSGLQIIDISNPSSPTLVGTYDTSGTAYGIYVSGKFAYVGDATSGLQIIDISNPSSPTLAGTYDTSGSVNQVYVSGKYAYVADGAPGLRIIDISNPSSPTLVGTYSSVNNISGVYIFGKYAYLADNTSGLQIIDISNPSSPTLAGTYDTSGFSKRVYVSGKYAYVADSFSGLQIIDISNPSSPTLVGTYDTSGNAWFVHISGKYAYVADATSGLQIIDISNPSSPTLVGTYDTSGSANGIYIYGKYAYVADGASGFQVIDINGIETPSLYAGSIQTNVLNVTENADIANNLLVRNGLNVGMGGIFTDGSLSVTGTTSSYIAYNLGIGTTSPFATLSVAGFGSFDNYVRASYFTATSTTATSTFPNLSLTNLLFGSDYLTDITGSGLSIINNALTVTGISSSTLANTIASFDSVGNLIGSSTLSISYGGTGLSTAPTFGQVLLGNSSGSYDLIGTSSLGIIANLSSVSGTLGVANGGTGASTFGQGWIYTDGGTGALNSSTSPTVNYITATSTTATSTFSGGLSVAGSTGLNVLQNGKVGVGTASPLGSLDISSGNVAIFLGADGSANTRTNNTQKIARVISAQYSNSANGATVFIANNTNSSNDLYIGGGSASYNAVTGINFYTGANTGTAQGTIRMAINNAGNVGVGSTTPWAQLSVNPSGITGPAFAIGSSTKTDFVVTNAGNVGIGTANPSTGYALTVNGDIDLVSRILAGEGSSASPSLTFRFGSGEGLFHTGSSVGFSTLSLERMRISSTGDVGIGTTSPYAKLSVVGQTVSEYFTATSTTASTFPYASTTALTVSGTNGLQLASGLNGPLQAVNGLVSSTSTLSISYGGTGLSTAPSYGQVLLGNATGGYTLTSTTSLGIGAGWDALSDISLTKGYFVVGDDAGLAQATSSLFVSSLGNIGIGSTSPYAKLSIQSPLAGTTELFSVSTSSRFSTLMSWPSASTTPNEYVKVASGGNSIFTGKVLNPTIVGGKKDDSLLAGARSVFVSGKYAYVANGTDSSLRIINVASTTNPYIVGGIKNASLLNGIYDVYVSGDYAYVVNSQDDSLRIVDVSNPASPSIVGGVKDASQLDSPRAVVVSGKYAYVASYTDTSLRIIDISNPVSPKIIGGVKDASLLNGPNSVFVQGKYAYVGNIIDNSLRIIDISNPTAPFIVGGVKDIAKLDGINSVYVSGNYAYVTDYNERAFRVIDVSNPTSPSIIGNIVNTTLFNNIQSVHVAGKYAYIVSTDSDYFVVVDISNPTSPLIVSAITNSSLLNGATSVFVSGQYAYVANTTDNCLRIIDIGGIEVSNLYAGNLETDTLSVTGFAQLNQGLSVRGGINGDSLDIKGFGSFTLATSTSYSSTHANPLTALTASVLDANTSGISNVSSLFHGGYASTSVGANGIGTGLAFASIDANGSATSTSQIASIFTNTSVSTPASALSFSIKKISGSLFEALRIDSTGNVGIGTTSPYAKLSVVGQTVSEYFTATSTTATSTFPNILATNLRLTGSLYDSTNSAGTNGYVLQSNGTTAQWVSTSSLNIAGGSGLSGGTEGMLASWTGASTLTATGTPTAASYFATSTTATSTFLGGFVAGTNGLNVLQNGNVGIGTISPSTKLDISAIAASDTAFIQTNDFASTFQIIHSPTMYARFGTDQLGYQFMSDLAGSGSPIVTLTRSTGNLGVGTTSPYAKLSVHANNGETNTSLFTIASSTGSATTTLFTVLNSGRVGVGISSPQAPFHIFSSGVTNETLPGFIVTRSDTSNQTHLQHYFAGINYLSQNLVRDVSGTWSMDNTSNPGTAIIQDTRAGQGYVAIFGNDATSGTFTPTERFRVGVNGNVGIGTTSPYAKLSVVGQTVSEYFTATSTTATSTFPNILATNLRLTGSLYDSTNSAGTNGYVLQSNGTTAQWVSTSSLNIAGGSGWDALSDISLTKGYFVVGDDAGLAQATSSLFVSSIGNIGIGSTTPYAKLSVVAPSSMFWSSTTPDMSIFSVASSSRESALYGYATSTPNEYFRIAAGGDAFITGKVLNPTFLAETSGPTPGTSLNAATSVFVSGKYAYVANQLQDSLVVIDISNPNSPTYVAETRGPTPGTSLDGANSVFVSGKYAYVANYFRDSLAVIDVSNPYSPTFVAETRGPTPTTSLDGAYAVFVSGKYAYVANYNRDSIAVIDISNPASPTFVAETRGPTPGTSLNGAAFVFVSGKYAYVASQNRAAVAVIDISNPSSPTFVAETQGPVAGTTLSGASSIFVSGKYAYVSNYNNGSFAVIDISNPSSPTFVADTRGPTPGTSLAGANSVFVSGKYAYVANASRDSIAVIDISNPAVPTFISETRGDTPGISLNGAASVFVSGKYAYVANINNDSLAVIDVGGAEVSNLYAGGIETDNLQVNAFAQLNQGLLVRGGINTDGGLFSQGQGVFTVASSTNFSTLNASTSLPFAVLSANIVDTNSSSITDALSLSHGAWSASANNIGVGIGFALEAADGFATSTSRIASIMTGTSVSAPTSALSFSIKNSSVGLTEALRIDSTGYLGIGSTTPWAQLSVNPNGITGPAFAIGSSTATRFIVTNVGNVGIGTTSPFATLSVAGFGSFDNYVRASYFTATSTNASTFPYASTTALTVSGTNGLQLASGLNGPLQAVNGLVSSTSTLSIGYGGTGTSTAPTYGKILIGNNNGGYDLTSTSSLGILASSAIGLGTQGFIPYYAASEQALTATSSVFLAQNSFVGIGTTTPTSALSVFSASAPQFQLAYNKDNYLTTGVSSSGGVTLAVNGTAGGLTITNPQPTSVVSGTGTAAPNSLQVNGATGGNSLDTNIGVGGIGGGIQFTAGVGGTALLATFSETGGAGGAVAVTGGIGGAAGSPSVDFMTRVAGQGGQLTFASGAGGDATNGGTGSSNTAGAGGKFVLKGGIGGNASGATSNTGGNGGSLYIAGGAGGTGSTANGSSGNVFLGYDSSSSIGNVYFGNQNVSYIGSTGNFGIGTTSPYAKLSVEGSSALGNSALAGYFTATSTTATSTFAGGLTAAVSSSDVGLTVLQNGRVGIGEKAPNKMFVVAGGLFQVDSESAQGNVGIGAYGSTLGTINEELVISSDWGSSSFTGIAFHDYNTSGVYKIGTDINNRFSIRNGSNTEFVSVISTGNLGIGTTSPYAKLSVVGQTVSEYFTATSTTATSTFPNILATNLRLTGSLYDSTNSAGTNGYVLQSNGTTAQWVSTSSLNIAGGSGLSGGTAGMLASWTGASTLTATGTPTAASYFATSTTATSTFLGGLSVAGSSGFNVLQNGNVGIGTISPSTKLDISAIAASDTAFIQTNDFASTFQIIHSPTMYARFGTDQLGYQFLDDLAGSGNPIVTIARSTGNVGIGTTSPYAKLSVHANNGETKTTLFTIASSTGAATTTLFTVLNSGNVGIGTSNPSYPLTVNNGDILAYSGYLRAANAGNMRAVIGGSDAFINLYNSSTVLTNVISTNGSSYINGGNVGVGTTTPWGLLSVNPNGIAGPQFVVGSSTKTDFVVTNAGNVGIGTANPSNALHVSATTARALRLQVGATGYAEIGIDNLAPNWGLGLWFNGTQQAHIYNQGISLGGYTHLDPPAGGIIASGNVGLGTSSPYAKLSVVGQTVSAYFTATTTTASTFPYASSTALTVSGALYNTSLADGCLNVTSGLIGSTGSACGAGASGGGVGWATSTDPGNLESIYFTGLANVGIGSTSPWAQLSVNPNGISGPAFAIGSSTATKFIVTNGGNVGINYANPTDALDVGGSIYATGSIVSDGYHSAGSAQFLGWTNRSVMKSPSDGVITFTNNGETDFSRLQFGGSTSAHPAIGKNGTSLYVGLADGSNGGKFGVGTSSPFAKLSIHANNGETNTTLFTVASSTGSATTTHFVVTNTGNAGIGTTSPSAKLAIRGDGTTTGRAFVVSNSSGAEKFAISDSGNVRLGLGVSAAATKLEVIGTDPSASVGTEDEIKLIRPLYILEYPKVASFKLGKWDSASLTSSSRLDIALKNGANGTYDADTTIMSLLSNTRVGIGTTSPFATLSVAGIGAFDNYVRASYFIATSTTASTFPYASSTALTVSGALYNTSLSNGCLNVTNGLIGSTGSACGAGASGGGVGWATSTDPGNLESIYFTGLANVGIGSTSPWAQLSVNPNGISGPAFAIGSSTATKFIVTNGGNVGIGTANPTYPLTVNGIVDINGSLYMENSNWIYADNYTNLASGADLTFKGRQAGSDLVFQDQNSNTVFKVLNAGNVGIGTTTPSAKLSVHANNGETNTSLFTIASSTGSATTTLFTVLNSGRVGIGKVPAAAYELDVEGDLAVTGGINNSSHITMDNTNAGFRLRGGLSVMSSPADGKFYFSDSSFTGNGTLVANSLGLGTTSPYAKLSVVGETVSTYFTATSTSATSTFAGGLNVGQGNLVYDFTTGITSVNALETGNLNFDTDAGAVSWADLPISSAPLNAVQSYTAQIGGTGVLTVYGLSNGSGGVATTSVAIGTSTPYTAGLTVWGRDTLTTTRVVDVVNNASTSLLTIYNGGAVSIGGSTSTTTINGYLDVLGTGTNSTSTISSNLWVKGTLRSNLSYVGDLIFANNFAFTEALPINSTTTQGLYLNNQNGERVLAIDDQGNLNITGDICAKNLVCFNESLDKLSEDLGTLASSTEGLGGIADSVNRTSSSVQTLADSIVALDLKVDAFIASSTLNIDSIIASTTLALASSTDFMNAVSSSTANVLNSNDSFIQAIANSVKNILASTQDWVVERFTAKVAYVNRVEAETVAISKGMEIVDQTTGSIWCVTIKNGDWNKVQGTCSAIASTTPIATPAVPDITPNPSILPTPTPVVTPVISTPATTTSPEDNASSTANTTAPTVSGGGNGGEVSPSPSPLPVTSVTPEASPEPVQSPVITSDPSPTSTPAPAEPAPSSAPAPSEAPAPVESPVAPIPVESSTSGQSSSTITE